MKYIISILLILLSFNSHSISYSKQKVEIKVNNKIKKVLTIEDLEKLSQTNFTLHDPYARNKIIKFQGILLSTLEKTFANIKTKKIEIIALNDYKVVIDLKLATSERMLLAIKGDGKYLSVREKGPARIVIPGGGLFKEGTLAKEGVNWVWFVKTINFL